MTTTMQRFFNKTPHDQPISTPLQSTIDFETRLFEELLTVAHANPNIILEDYDLDAVRQQIVRPIAAYMQAVTNGRRKSGSPQAPLIVSGDPGIGKTTLLMMIDQALAQLAGRSSFSARELVTGDSIAGYYGAFKGRIDVTPLSLRGTPTGVLSILDWRNIQRHWTYDSRTTHRETREATADFLNTFTGKIVFVDDAEREGHVYVVSQLAQQSILVVISSNLDHTMLHIDDLSPAAVHLSGKDHRVGDISAVCVPAGEHRLFDAMHDHVPLAAKTYERFKIIESDSGRVVYARWSHIKDQPLLKDNFAAYFRQHNIAGVLLDEFPFFTTFAVQDINPGTLGRLYRFVHLIDAVHDMRLPFMLRMTQALPLTADYRAEELERVLHTYDKNVSSHAGTTMWIEITRCLSRLRSREALNAAFFPIGDAKHNGHVG